MRRQTDRRWPTVLTAKDGQGLPEGDQRLKRSKEEIAPELWGQLSPTRAQQSSETALPSITGRQLSLLCPSSPLAHRPADLSAFLCLLN